MLGLSFEVVISLAPISASSTDLKRNQTPHSLFRSFRADNPFQLVDQETEFNLESKLKQVLAPVNHLAITPEGCSRRHSKVLTAKSLAKLLGQLSSTALAGHQVEQRVLQSLQQSLLATTCLL